jgi:hypothetical protein
MNTFRTSYQEDVPSVPIVLRAGTEHGTGEGNVWALVDGSACPDDAPILTDAGKKAFENIESMGGARGYLI